MKNIHILPTDKPSSIGYDGDKNLHLVNMFIDDYQNIYITSDEEIKEGDWYLDTTVNVVFKNDKIFLNGVGYKKIILTTDQDLIKDGVQKIDDEFLEWFVKNQNYEYVKVEDYGNLYNFRYLILIPKEEAMNMKEEFEKSVNIITDWLEKNGDPVADKQVEQEAKELFKQETLEEFTKQEAIKQYSEDTFGNLIVRKSIEKGAKWQQERMYSEEELLSFGKSCFYEGFEKAEKDDANCFTAFREEVGSLVKKFKNK